MYLMGEASKSIKTAFVTIAMHNQRIQWTGKQKFAKETDKKIIIWHPYSYDLKHIHFWEIYDDTN